MKKIILIVLLVLILFVIGVELIYYNTVTECCSPCSDGKKICPTVCAPCHRNFFEKVSVLFNELIYF